MDMVDQAMCDSCGCEPFKYRCPGCSTRSCSLSCVKRHKLEQGCSGSRSKTAFVPLNQFSDNLLYSDYYFLEEVGRCVDAAHRDRIHSLGQMRDSKGAEQRFRRLKLEAAQRGIKLQLLAEGMSLHCSNSSHTMRAASVRQRRQRKSEVAGRRWEIRWCIRLLFPQADMNYQEENVRECMVLRELLDRYIHPTASEPIARHQLAQYVKARDSIHVLMKDNSQLGAHRYHQLNLELSLCENFVGKTIVEYPQLIIVLGSYLSEYCLLDDLFGGEEKTGVKGQTEMKERVIQATTHQQQTVITEKSECQEMAAECCKEDASALQLIAQSYSDSDEDSR